MYEILKLNSISKKIYDVLDDSYHVADDVEAPDAVLVRSASMAEFDIKDNLLAVARAGAGVNNIPLPRMTEKGVVVFNTPGANANAVKELVLCGMLLASRDVIGGIRWANGLAGNGDAVPKMVEKGKSQFGGHEILGKTLGVIGLGAIGAKIAIAAHALGMEVIGYDPFLSDTVKTLLNGVATFADSAETVIASADFLTLHVPLLDSTRAMINRDSIATMKDGAVILNMSRAELVNVPDLKEALASGKIARYVVDFPTEDVLNTEHIIAIPHLGASTEEAEDNCAVMAAAQLKDYLENGNIRNSVNFPSLQVERSAEHRMCVIYNAGTDAIACLRQILDGINYQIHSVEKKGVGYAVIDTDVCFGEMDDDLFDRLGALDNIVSIRLI